MKPTAIVLAAALFACEFEKVEEPIARPVCRGEPIARQDSCIDADFYGDAPWKLIPNSTSPDSIALVLKTNFEGVFNGTIDSTEEGRVITGQAVGALTLPLGQDSFTISGTWCLRGVLITTDSLHQADMTAIAGAEGFVNAAGGMYWDWIDGDDVIHYVGDVCAPRKAAEERR